MPEDIEIYELKKMDIRGATVIDGFPSVGLVSSIVANYLINTLDLIQIGMMDSVYFPTVSLVRDGLPHNPVRIYAGEKVGSGPNSMDQIVVFISEFQPPPNLVKPIASAMIDWAQDQKCKMVISPEGLVIDTETIDMDEEEKARLSVYGVGSTDWMREELAKSGVEEFTEGVITGVAGVLLNEGKRRDFNVATVLAEAHPDFPDARAAAKVMEYIGKLLLHINLDVTPLYQEAERIESQLKSIHKQTKDMKASGQNQPSMYG
ncbi:MAG: proteasome assembly chaperone family protein [Euryarchaeota archaeon]|nr:proteasome assembly chaperone family protein [Euryarchaeota archaeon]MBU4072308.1 PAC2 family protein [Candidatus Thermoplasmatota archaeon]MBU4143844.1 PAC2 family protein [Candidatus Thermoplasmatota archaeon]